MLTCTKKNKITHQILEGLEGYWNDSESIVVDSDGIEFLEISLMASERPEIKIQIKKSEIKESQNGNRNSRPNVCKRHTVN